MSYILCRQEPVETPYYMEELGLHLYSSQELCYVIYHYPLLVLDGFLDDRLTAFLRNELRLPFLAERIEKWLETRGESDELLFQILADCAFYTRQEQAKFREEVAAYRKLPPDEYQKKRADYFYELGLYGKAIALYGGLLEGTSGNLTADLKGRLCNNIAACYARLFCYQKAMHSYERAWDEDPKENYLREMYFLTLKEPKLAMKERCAAQVSEEQKAAWDMEYQVLLKEQSEPESLKELELVFAKDPIRRLAGAGQILNRWKLEYRKMV